MTVKQLLLLICSEVEVETWKIKNEAHLFPVGATVGGPEVHIVKSTLPPDLASEKVTSPDQSLRKLWVNFKWPNTHIIEIPEGEGEKEGKRKKIRKMFEEFPILTKNSTSQMREAPKHRSQAQRHN